MTTLWIICIITLASLIKGITGFGFALVALPPLLLWYAPSDIIPVIVICNFISSTIIILQKKDLNLVPRKARYMIATASVFTLFGVLILKHLTADSLTHSISLIFITLTGLSFFRLKTSIKIPDFSYPVIGAIIGLLAGCTSVGGPPLAIFLNAAKVSNQQFRVIFSWFNIATASIAIIGYAIAGLITMESLHLVLLFTPVLFLGTFIGKKLNSKIPSLLFKKSTLVITLISCIILLLK
ncbi:sulfite exporter TauE/SafE family protein [Plebeiibacterium marinum]|uniref:Probable membrane transporter protein n=1 Tax=Plebeiibacterium marinum TaxID=2992111 RepID=A0AAE3SJ69_9BACT|nr:sulfite exporter TauE/SafE family protein [Plebeiobacterium marinum]MCW3805417.1 sulfite exporter TauE/SafE family protein [Plebeiobacterium marinum]